jgi:hypothetical protein
VQRGHHPKGELERRFTAAALGTLQQLDCNPQKDREIKRQYPGYYRCRDVIVELDYDNTTEIHA